MIHIFHSIGILYMLYQLYKIHNSSDYLAAVKVAKKIDITIGEFKDKHNLSEDTFLEESQMDELVDKVGGSFNYAIINLVFLIWRIIGTFTTSGILFLFDLILSPIISKFNTNERGIKLIAVFNLIVVLLVIMNHYVFQIDTYQLLISLFA